MMPNQERVLHGLDSCGFHDGIPNICEVTECPYRDDKCGCVHELAHDAGLLISELLKAQEPVEPKVTVYHILPDGTCDISPRMVTCGACGECLPTGDATTKYCPTCGRAVKWDD